MDSTWIVLLLDLSSLPAHAANWLFRRVGVEELARTGFFRFYSFALRISLRLSRPVLVAVQRWLPGRSQRSLWAGTPIITLAICARAERLLGIEADSLVFTTYYMAKDYTFDLSRWNRGPLLWTNVLLPYCVLMWACLRYQRFHFFYDRGILPASDYQFNQHELELLRYLGKDVYFYAYGADVRTRRRTESLGTPNCCTECPRPGDACICDDHLGSRMRQLSAANATMSFSMGDMIHYTPGSRNDLYYWPIDLEAECGERYRPCFPDARADRPLRIVHAPNHRGFKGTRFLLEAVERLRKEGASIELVLVEKVCNRQALDIYRSADVIFDQCLIGFHGFFALEALAMGKPVMVFIRDPQAYLIVPDECPFVNTPVGMIEENLRKLLNNRAALRKLGEAGRAYIEKYHSFPAFTSRLALVYKEVEQRKAALRLPNSGHEVKEHEHANATHASGTAEVKAA